MSQTSRSPIRSIIVTLVIFLVSSIIAGLLSPQLPVIRATLLAPAPDLVHVKTPTATPTLAPTATPTAIIGPAVQMVQLRRDYFARKDRTLWGADQVEDDPWLGDANAQPAFTISGNHGLVAGPGFYTTYLPPATSNMKVQLTASISTTHGAAFGAILHYKNKATWYAASLDGEHLNLLKHNNGHSTVLQSVPFILTPDTAYTLSIQIYSTTLIAKAWSANAPEPHAWQLQTSDSDLGLGFGGLFVDMTQPATITFYDFTIYTFFA